MNDEQKQELNRVIDLITQKEKEYYKLALAVGQAIIKRDENRREQFTLMIQRFCLEYPQFKNWQNEDLIFEFEGKLLFFQGFPFPISQNSTKIDKLEFFVGKKDKTKGKKTILVRHWEFDRLTPLK